MSPMPKFHACRLVDPDKCVDGSWRTADTKFGGKPVQILYAKLTSSGKSVRQSIHFPTAHWSAAEAKGVCPGTFEPAAED